MYFQMVIIVMVSFAVAISHSTMPRTGSEDVRRSVEIAGASPNN